MYSPLLNRSAATSSAMEASSWDSNTSGMQNRAAADNQNDASAKAPSFLFGQKRRSVAPSTPSYANNPYSAQNAPSNDIFASPIPSQLRGESAGSGKSVHWSPALVQERSHPYDGPRSTLKTLPSQSASQFTPSSNLSPAPPLRSMRDSIEPVRKVSRRSMSMPVSDSSFSTTGYAKSPVEQTSPSSADTWVTVYGFPPEQAANVLKHFSRHGEIVSHQVPSRGNWMHIRYSCPVHARQALSRNATLIDSSLRIGVVPCTEKEIIGADVSQLATPILSRTSVVDQSISEEAPLEIPSITPSKENQDSLDESMNRSRLSTASRAGMRSLTVSYDSRQDTKNTQPVKHDSIMNKLWTAVGL